MALLKNTYAKPSKPTHSKLKLHIFSKLKFQYFFSFLVFWRFHNMVFGLWNWEELFRQAQPTNFLLRLIFLVITFRVFRKFRNFNFKTFLSESFYFKAALSSRISIQSSSDCPSLTTPGIVSQTKCVFSHSTSSCSIFFYFIKKIKFTRHIFCLKFTICQIFTCIRCSGFLRVFNDYIDVDDECWWQNILMTMFWCWWHFRHKHHSGRSELILVSSIISDVILMSHKNESLVSFHCKRVLRQIGYEQENLVQWRACPCPHHQGSPVYIQSFEKL